MSPAKSQIGAPASLAEEIGTFGQVVLVLQGGGALGAYQIGVFEALSEAGIEPDWVIGTSIGAINAALIAGNAPEDRMERLAAFWDRVEQPAMPSFLPPQVEQFVRSSTTLLSGLPGFFQANPMAFANPLMPLGADAAGYYSTRPLRETLKDLVDLERINEGPMRLTVGAASVRDSRMHYFDRDEERLGLDHILASGALPPAFPAVRIDGELYWDGGILSNTPIEHIFDANPRRDAMIFTVQLWSHEGDEPETIWDVMNRQKDVQFSSRVDNHIRRQRQIHRLRHMVAELAKHLPEEELEDPAVQEMKSWGCLTRMHIVRLLAPRLPHETHLKDIDFSPVGIRERRSAGYNDTCRVLEEAPWRDPFDPNEGLILHDTYEGHRVQKGEAGL